MLAPVMAIRLAKGIKPAFCVLCTRVTRSPLAASEGWGGIKLPGLEAGLGKAGYNTIESTLPSIQFLPRNRFL